MDFNTKLLHGNAVKRYQYGATLPPISQVSAFAYETSEELEKVFHNKAPGFAYSRIGNPAVSAFEQRVCELEKGKGAAACSSGMSAVTLALLNILSEGDEVIAGSGLFGGTIDLLGDFQEFGITTRFIRHITVEDIEPLINERTKVVFGEVIGNPGLDIEIHTWGRKFRNGVWRNMGGCLAPMNALRYALKATNIGDLIEDFVSVLSK